MPLALRLALREMRADLRRGLGGFRLFLACLALGVAAMAGIGSLAAALQGGLSANAARLLGGDLAFSLPQRDPPAAALAWLARHGRLSQAVTLRAMLRRDDGTKPALVALQAVDGAYPLYGAVDLDPALPPARALATQNGIPGIAVAPELLQRMGLAPGDRLRLGDTVFAIRARLLATPDDSGGLFALGPPALITLDGLKQSGLDRPGTLSTHEWRLRLRPGLAARTVLAEAKARFSAVDWQARMAASALPGFNDVIAEADTVLALIGLGALMLGGIGVAAAVAAHLERRRTAIAILKSLGASSGLVIAVYLGEIMTLALIGIALGVAAGAALPALVAGCIGNRLPIALATGPHAEPLGFAAGAGFCVALTATLWPLAGIRDISAAGLLRVRLAPSPSWRRRLIALPPFAVLIALVLLGTAAPALALKTGIGVLGMMALLLVLGGGIARLARALSRRLPSGTGLAWRLGLGNLHRPGAATPATVLALGLGLSALIAIAVIDENLSRFIAEAIPARAPSLFFIDIQPDEIDRFSALAAGMPGITDLRTMPSLRTRIARLNGVPLDRVALDPATRRLIDSDRGLTYSAALPAGSRVVAGAWWPADYRGSPLLSLDANLAASLRLGIGDTVTLNIAGREITARIANLRHIDWSSLGINFFMVMAPGTLEPAPQTHIATLHAANPAVEDRLEQAVADRFPNVSTIHVATALARIAGLLRDFTLGIALMAGILVAAGFLVLAGIVASGAERHREDAAILRALGAERALIARLHLVEYGLLGLGAGLAAALLGTAGAWLAVARLMGVPWHFTAYPVALIPALALPAIMLIGCLGTWRRSRRS